MQHRQFTTGGCFSLAAGPGGVWAAAFGEADVAQPVRVALERDVNAAVDQLARADGFLGNPQAHPAARGVEQRGQTAEGPGQQKQVDELVTAMNRAAEAAVPRARKLLVSMARSISVDDAIEIVRGGDSSVTDYFAGKTRAQLAGQVLPIVAQATEKLDLASRYNAVADKAGQFGLLKSDEVNVQHHVNAKSLDALFLMIGEEARKIRRDPVGSSAILKKVVGG